MTSELIIARQFNMWFLIAFETLALSRSRYLQWWVTQQPVLGEPWRVLSFCHLHDKLPRQWTWRAGTLIQLQLLTLGIRLHAFAGLGKESPPQKERKKEKKKIILTQSNKMKGNILYLAEDSSRWTALIWAQIWFRDSILQTALYSKWFGSIVFARNSRNKERKSQWEGKGKNGRKGRDTYISQWESKRAQRQKCSQISLVSN